MKLSPPPIAGQFIAAVPPSGRWTASYKEELLAADNAGLLSETDRMRLNLTVDELAEWRRSYADYGLRGLKTTKHQRVGSVIGRQKKRGRRVRKGKPDLSAGLTALALLASSPVYAGVISEPISALDAIYSQPAFGNSPIDVRFNIPLTFVRPDLLHIDNGSQQQTIWDLGAQLDPDPSRNIDAFFVDTISFCSGPAPTGFAFIGCALLPGHSLYLNSMVAASFGSIGADLFAHELGHNLGLSHVGDNSSTGNLMNPIINSDVLTVDQAAAVLSSPLIQFDPDGDRFISITPIAITAAAQPAPVSEPNSLLTLLASLSVLFLSCDFCKSHKERAATEWKKANG